MHPAPLRSRDETFFSQKISRSPCLVMGSR
jgi:hypothetical protein